MDARTATLLTEIIIIPVLKELAARRGVHGVTKENIEALVKNPQQVLTNLQQSKSLQVKAITDFADAIDNVAGDAIDALVSIFADQTPGVS